VFVLGYVEVLVDGALDELDLHVVAFGS
jgi:hypothetical protein